MESLFYCSSRTWRRASARCFASVATIFDGAIRSVRFLGAVSACSILFSVAAATPAAADMAINLENEWIDIGDDFPKKTQDRLVAHLKARQGNTPRKEALYVRMTGEITPRWIVSFNNAITFARRENYRLVRLGISSPGGDIRTALALGRLLFKFETQVWVESECISACVFVLAGATARSVWARGTVGVHRPFDPRVGQISTSGAELDAKYRQISDEIAKFFREMAVSPQLHDLMMSTPSTRVRILSRQERDDFGLGDDNVAFTELAREHRVRECGYAYARRQEQAKQESLTKCMAFTPDVDPNEISSLKGLSSDKYSGVRNCMDRIHEAFGVNMEGCRRKDP